MAEQEECLLQSYQDDADSVNARQLREKCDADVVCRVHVGRTKPSIPAICVGCRLASQQCDLTNNVLYNLKSNVYSVYK